MRTKLKVTLYSVNVALRSHIRKAFDGHQYEVIEVTDSKKFGAEDSKVIRQDTIDRLNLPDNADYVVTTTGLNSKVEGLAATLSLKQGRNDVYVIVLPEGMDFLRNKLDQRGELVLVGADQSK
ncbi:hypothetical protein JRC04_05280 [Mycolicibacterium sp. S2-37]|uniref:hypothetical protein n=1 Tax=Mycolicibacterium sp. S2-37 TaxID=2810297 RepID=UPI001A941B86|nr:hypothetical protein [Mycolicibacterium sp. S2-37]MBO0676867.1 hypothetical protein [Mycolicibacterium sp. S2-37]